MKDWLRISVILCVFGFLRDIRPSEPYVTEYILGPWREITSEELNREVYPVGTYSYLAQLIIVFLVTDMLRYKPVIIAMGCAGIIVWSLLLWTTSLAALQVDQFFYGTYMAAEVAYYTYIYAKVDKKYYPKVTSHTRAAMLCGKLVAGVSSQLLVNSGLMDYRQLNYITLGTQVAATAWAFLLPNVKTSTYFHRDSTERNSPRQAVSLLWSHFKNAYSNVKVIEWSLWYALGLSCYYQVISYMQVLWKTIEPNPEVAWNGAAEASLTLLGALLALLAGYIHAGRFGPLGSLLVLATLSVLQGGAILLSVLSNNLYASYAGYVIFGSLFAFTITIASAEVARHLEEDSYGLVFGINTFVALIIQTVLTIAIVSEQGFALDIYQQYFVYAYYFITIGVLFFVAVGVEWIWFRGVSSASMDVIVAS